MRNLQYKKMETNNKREKGLPKMCIERKTAKVVGACAVPYRKFCFVSVWYQLAKIKIKVSYWESK